MIFFEIGSGQPDCRMAALKKCMAFLQSADFAKTDRSVPVDIGEGISCTVSRYETVREEAGVWEAHRRYADLQCVLSGEEKIGIAQTDQSRITDYLEERDFLSLEGEATAWVTLKPGMALCLFPNDAHMVKIQTKDSAFVTKAVFKIPISLFE